MAHWDCTYHVELVANPLITPSHQYYNQVTLLAEYARYRYRFTATTVASEEEDAQTEIREQLQAMCYCTLKMPTSPVRLHVTYAGKELEATTGGADNLPPFTVVVNAACTLTLRRLGQEA